MDVEVAVRGDAMDIGVFSSSPAYSAVEAEAMVETIVDALAEVE